MSEIDWAAINEKLPIGRDPESKERRKKMFSDFDVNGNRLLSLAEVDKATRDVLKIDEIYDFKGAISHAFKIAKNCTKSIKSEVGDDYIEFREFRFFLLSLRQYFEYGVAFRRIDVNKDHKISLVEFKEAQSNIEKWVGKIDAEEEFKKIDTNGGGAILFDEFCEWAIKKNLDLADDVDDSAM